MGEYINRRTDCWRCGRTFTKPKLGELKIAGFMYIAPMGCAHTYDQDDILCTDCIDEEIEEEFNKIERS